MTNNQNKVSILLTDEFGEEILITPVNKLPMKTVVRLSALETKTVAEQFTGMLELIRENIQHPEDITKFEELTQDEFTKFLERWFAA